MDKVNNTVIDIISGDFCACMRPNKKMSFKDSEDEKKFKNALSEVISMYSNSPVEVKIHGHVSAK